MHRHIHRHIHIQQLILTVEDSEVKLAQVMDFKTAPGGKAVTT